MFNLFGKEPHLLPICLDADNLSGGDSGQATIPSGDSLGMDNLDISDNSGIDPTPEEYFHSITIPGEDGKDEVLNFKDRKELNDKFLENYLRRSDYTKKTTATANRQKELDAREAAFAERETALLRMQNQASQYKEIIEALPEEQFQKLLKQVQGQSSRPETEADRQLKAITARLQKEDQQKAAAERKAKQKERFDTRGRYLKTQLADYDHESVMSAYEQLMNAPEEMVEQTVLEMLYYANKGRGASQPAGDPQGPPRTRSGAGGITPSQKVMSIEEARQAALKSLPPRQPIA